MYQGAWQRRCADCVGDYQDYPTGILREKICHISGFANVRLTREQNNFACRPGGVHLGFLLYCGASPGLARGEKGEELITYIDYVSSWKARLKACHSRRVHLRNIYLGFGCPLVHRKRGKA